MIFSPVLVPGLQDYLQKTLSVYAYPSVRLPLPPKFAPLGAHEEWFRLRFLRKAPLNSAGMLLNRFFSRNGFQVVHDGFYEDGYTLVAIGDGCCWIAIAVVEPGKTDDILSFLIC